MLNGAVRSIGWQSVLDLMTDMLVLKEEDVESFLSPTGGVGGNKGIPHVRTGFGKSKGDENKGSGAELERFVRWLDLDGGDHQKMEGKKVDE